MKFFLVYLNFVSLHYFTLVLVKTLSLCKNMKYFDDIFTWDNTFIIRQNDFVKTCNTYFTLFFNIERDSMNVYEQSIFILTMKTLLSFPSKFLRILHCKYPNHLFHHVKIEIMLYHLLSYLISSVNRIFSKIWLIVDGLPKIFEYECDALI